MKMTDEIDILRESIKKYDNAICVKKLNENLYEHLTGSLYFILKYSEKHNIPLPNKDKLFDMVKKSDFIVEQFQERLTNLSNPSGHDTTQEKTGHSDYTEPYGVRFSSIKSLGWICISFNTITS